MKLPGMNGKRTMIIVHPNTSQSLRLVLVDGTLADELCAWLRQTRVPHQRTTTILPGAKKTTEESARVYKLLMDFRRGGGASLQPGVVQ